MVYLKATFLRLYPNFTMTWMMSLVNSFAFDFGRGKPARRLGIYFHGVNGTLYANYGMYQVVPEGDLMKGCNSPGKVDPTVSRPRARMARLYQEPAATQLQSRLSLQGGCAHLPGQLIDEVGPGDPLRFGR